MFGSDFDFELVNTMSASMIQKVQEDIERDMKNFDNSSKTRPEEEETGDQPDNKPEEEGSQDGEEEEPSPDKPDEDATPVKTPKAA
jgi:hypothetical protein